MSTAITSLRSDSNRAEVIHESLPVRQAGAIAKIFDYLQLTKPRLVSMVLLSALVGFYLGSQNSVNIFLFIATLTATALVSSGSMALNQFLEREADGRMLRTQNRPLPAGRLQPRAAFWFGALLSLFGFLCFIFFVNLTSAVLALATWLSYLFVYTPLKAKTSLSTLAGAVPGAFPPVIGWAAAGNALNVQAFLLFLTVFFWQMPHFLAIAWMYRDDYARAGFPMLSVIDREGQFVARQMIVNMCALLPVSLLPTLFGMTGTAYFFGAFLLGICFAAVIIFAAPHLDLRARYALRASIIYLAALLFLMMMDKI